MKYLCSKLKKLSIPLTPEFRGENTALGKVRPDFKEDTFCTNSRTQYKKCTIESNIKSSCLYSRQGGPFLIEPYNNLLNKIHELYNHTDNLEVKETCRVVINTVLTLQEPNPSDLNSLRNFLSEYVGVEFYESIDDAILEFTYKTAI
jgi:hypothetical protein